MLKSKYILVMVCFTQRIQTKIIELGENYGSLKEITILC